MLNHILLTFAVCKMFLPVWQTVNKYLLKINDKGTTRKSMGIAIVPLLLTLSKCFQTEFLKIVVFGNL